MPFPFDKYPWTNFQELNLAYFIKHFREIFQQWADLYNEMQEWKTETDGEIQTLLDRADQLLEQSQEILNNYYEWVEVTQQNTADIAELTPIVNSIQNTVNLLLRNKVNVPATNPYGSYGYFLMTRGNENTEWVPRGIPTEAEVQTALDALLQTHPEWRATVPDNSLTANKLVNGTLGYVTPEMYGYDFELHDDCTPYVTACINAIRNGDVRTNKIVFTHGTYTFGGILLERTSEEPYHEYEITIWPGAEIRIKAGANYFFSWGRHTTMKMNGGGKVNGYSSGDYPAYLFAAYVNRGQQLIVENLEFYNIKKYGFYCNELGGEIAVRNCFVHDMRYKDGSEKPAEFFHLASGQRGYPGSLLVTGNKFIETSYTENDFIGGPCAFFICDVVDSSQQEYGNDSTAIFENNNFDGLSDPTGPSYTIHVYYDWKSVLITNNIFKHYYENAIGLKDSSNITVQGNVFIDGLTGHTSGRAAYAGTIDIQSSDHTPGLEHGNFKILGNTFQNAPVKLDNSIADFIHVRGREINNVIEQYCKNVIISDNIFDNGNRAVWTNGVNNLSLSNNKSTACGLILSAKGLGFYNIIGNSARSGDSSVISTNEGMENVDYVISDNSIEDVTTITSSIRLIFIRSVKSCVFTGNSIITALSNVKPAEFNRYDANSANIGDLLVNDNIIQGATTQITYNFAYIDGVRGMIYGGSSITTPINNVKASGRGTCIFTDANSNYYISRAAGNTTSSWRQITVTTPSA